jgi:hypothetical protein
VLLHFEVGLGELGVVSQDRQGSLGDLTMKPFRMAAEAVDEVALLIDPTIVPQQIHQHQADALLVLGREALDVKSRLLQCVHDLAHLKKLNVFTGLHRAAYFSDYRHELVDGMLRSGLRVYCDAIYLLRLVSRLRFSVVASYRRVARLKQAPPTLFRRLVCGALLFTV